MNNSMNYILSILFILHVSFTFTFFTDYQKYSYSETVKSTEAWTVFFTKQARYHASACSQFLLSHSYDPATLATVTSPDFYMYLALSCVSYLLKEQQSQYRFSYFIIFICRRDI